MSLPNIVQVTNLTGGNISISDMGIPIAAFTTITLTTYATISEIKDSASLYTLIFTDQALLALNDINLSKSESLRFFIETYDNGSRGQADAVADTNVALLGVGGTIDGVLIVQGMRILLTAQSTSSENGIWVAKAGAWERPYDFSSGQSVSGTSIIVRQGVANGDAIWVCSSDPGNDIVEVNDLFFSKQEASGGSSGVPVISDNSLQSTVLEEPTVYEITSVVGFSII